MDITAFRDIDISSAFTPEELAEMKERDEAPLRGKSPQELSYMVLNKKNELWGRMNALRRLHELDEQLGVETAQIIAQDKREHFGLRMLAVELLPKAPQSIIRNIAMDKDENDHVKQRIFTRLRNVSDETLVEVMNNRDEKIPLRRWVFTRARLPEEGLFAVVICPDEDLSIRLQALTHPSMSQAAVDEAVEMIVNNPRNRTGFQMAALYNARLSPAKAAELAVKIAEARGYGVVTKKTALNHPAVSEEVRREFIARFKEEAAGDHILEREFDEAFGD